jgi:SagB-type dehydrogenase family enzyme
MVSPSSSSSENVRQTDGLWLADDLVVELCRENRDATVVVPGSRHRVQVSISTLFVLCEVAAFNHSGHPANLEDLVSHPNPGDLISRLIQLGVLVRANQRTPPTCAKLAHMMSPVEWATLRMSQVGGCFDRSGSGAGPTSRAQHRPADEAVLALPTPEVSPDVRLWDTLIARRSSRTGPTRQVSLATVSALFAYSFRVQHYEDGFGEISFRPVASGGARHPIDVFFAAIRVTGLQSGLYKYDPFNHSVIQIDICPSTSDWLSRLALLAVDSPSQNLPALTIFFSAIPARTATKYEDISLALILKDVGCATQQLYLLVQGLGLVGCAIGAADPVDVEERLRLVQGREVFVGGFVIW